MFRTLQNVIYALIDNYESNYNCGDPLIWQRVIMFTLLSASLLVFIIGYLSYNQLFRKLPSNTDENELPLLAFVYSNILPNRALSRICRPLTRKKIPKKWRSFIYGLAGYFFPIQWHEFKKDLTEYTTIHEFFTRRLEFKRSMARTDLVSPVDGTVVAFGEVDSETQTLEQIKGVRFHLPQFLYGYDQQEYENGYDKILKKGNKLYYTIIYLAPGDYHRFHSPANGIKIDCINHIVGDLYPVKPTWLKKIPGLFSLNERMVMSGKWQDDLFFSYVPVGAFNIGSIHLKDDPYHMTNQLQQDEEIWYRQQSNPCHKDKECGYECNHEDENKAPKKCINKFGKDEELIYDKGDEIGHFSFGSTVAILFEAPNFDFHIKRGKIRFGDALGDIGLFE